MFICKLYNFIKNYVIALFYSIINSFKKIDSKKIILWSYNGNTFSCSPKYITEYIINNNIDFKIVWAFKTPEEFKFLEKSGIKVVEFKKKDFFKELMTSKFIITNARFGLDFHKRKNQIYIQTWHGTMALKTIEKDAEKSLKKVYVANAKSDSKKIDFVLSGCEAFTNIIKSSFWYNGTILNFGLPRNDLFFEQKKCKEKVCKKYNIKGKNIILYAPTFRNNGDLSIYNLNYKLLIDAINHKFNYDCVILARLHPNLKGKKIIDSEQNNVFDVTDYDDMQELLSSADILITDFSSSMFDFIIMKKVCFLYASDFFNYLNNERKLYFDIENDLPFSLAKNTKELIDNIKKFDLNSYYNHIEEYRNLLNFYDDGTASKKIVDFMLKE